MLGFQYSPDILARYPTIIAGVILAEGMNNTSTPESLQSSFQAEQRNTLQRIGNTPLSQSRIYRGLASSNSQFRR